MVRVRVRCASMSTIRSIRCGARDARRTASAVALRSFLALASAVSPFAQGAVAVAQDGAPAGPPPTPVRVGSAREETLAPRRRVFGELRAVRRATVAAEEAGIVVEVAAREGERVAEGAVLVRLDDARLRLELAAIEASTEAARATTREREAALVREERDLELLARAESEGAVNPRERLNAESAVAVAAAQLGQARAAVVLAERQEALLADRLGDLVVRAPFAGVVTRRDAEEGAWISEGGAVVELVDDRRLEGWFDLPQELLAAARALAGNADATALAAFELAGPSGRRVDATALRVVPEVDPRSRTFHAVARIDAPSADLAPGLALSAFVPEGAARAWTLVPKDALVYRGTSASVFVVRDGRAAPVAVRVAFPYGEWAALDPGSVRAGDEVVVEGNERLMPGAAVVPVVAPREAAAASADGDMASAGGAMASAGGAMASAGGATAPAGGAR